MSSSAKRAKATSVRARLLNLANQQQRPFDLLVQRYAIERLLYRLTRSSHADSFILKGAMVFLTWGIDLPRPTRDLDLMGLVTPETRRLVEIFGEIVSVPVEEDGLHFDAQRITAEQIREEEAYAGIRVKVPALLGSMRIALQIDVGTGDSLIPEPEKTAFPSLLGDDPPVLRSYSRYLMVAEKFEAMVKLGEINSRMKDYYDVWLMARTFDFDLQALREALVHTFTRRGTELPGGRPPALSEAFHGTPAKQQQWRAFATKAKLAGELPGLTEVCDVVWGLIVRALVD